MKSQGQNNFNMNNRNNKPFYYRQNNDRQFGGDNRFKKDKINYGDNYSSNYNMRYNPNKDDCLIIFPNNYFTFDSKDFDELKNDLKRELKDDIYNIYYNYCIPNISEKIFRFTTNFSSEYPLKAKAIRIIADFIFDIMKSQSDKVTYLKINFLIPENVIGFIIGINGKNINQIREETNAKIEVYSLNNTKNYRKVEISGVPQIIANAAEKIYIITRKYFYFNNEKILNRNDPSPQKGRDIRDNWGRERNRGDGYHMDNFKERDNDRRGGRYYEGNWNKNYNNNNNTGDKDYNKGMYNKERYEYKDMGYKNDYKNREGYRNYGNRDMKKNSRDSWNKNNNNYNRDNGPRYKGGKNNYDKDKNIDEQKEDNWSNKSFSKKSGGDNSEEIRSPNVENDGDWPDEKDERNDDINNRQNLDEGKDLKDNLNENNNNNYINHKHNLFLPDINNYLNTEPKEIYSENRKIEYKSNKNKKKNYLSYLIEKETLKTENRIQKNFSGDLLLKNPTINHQLSIKSIITNNTIEKSPSESQAHQNLNKNSGSHFLQNNKKLKEILGLNKEHNNSKKLKINSLKEADNIDIGLINQILISPAKKKKKK
jgi:hypothetical protein